MSSANVRIRVRAGANEAEIEAPKDELEGMIGMIPDILSRMGTAPLGRAEAVPRELPDIRVEKGESLPSIVSKLFFSQWGRQPRKLLDVKETLESFGLVYPKQSVAVALLRLAKDGKLRRFKQPDGEFVYTASTSLLSLDAQVTEG
ncbi:MAG: hypothetical protein JRN39_05745 [Nitrososphaerota archaeon]|nr:hypothetical protein [Nitrososphaerota archaeon]